MTWWKIKSSVLTVLGLSVSQEKTYLACYVAQSSSWCRWIVSLEFYVSMMEQKGVSARLVRTPDCAALLHTVMHLLSSTYWFGMDFISDHWHVSTSFRPRRWRDAFIAAWEAAYNWQNSITLASTLRCVIFTAHWASHRPGHRSICTPGKPNSNSCITIPWSVFQFVAHQRCWSNAWWWIKSRIFCWYHGERWALIFMLWGRMLIHWFTFQVLHVFRGASSYYSSLEPSVWPRRPEANHSNRPIWYINIHVPIWTFEYLRRLGAEVRASRHSILMLNDNTL